ncbi:hypothetical protein AURDEDRAFT_111507 [Auricularia subglabra TFB-10046 SS5]|nr:hypothetical protein AURDEDRAFT_111507 [Auricularia subglabra TFB-10046 SS5]
MQTELRRCIETGQQLLADLGGSQSASRALNAESFAVISAIANSGIPKIEDSRVPDSLNLKFHALTETYFQQACAAFRETHGHLDPLSLRTLAVQLKATWTSLYERQIINAANLRSKSSHTQKQPYANDVLLYAFEQSQNPTKREREQLAALTGLTREQVRVWFQNRRSRSKKKAPELQSRVTLQLSELLQRVAASSKAMSGATVTFDNIDNEYEDDCDSRQLSCAYRPCLSVSTHWQPAERPVQSKLSASASTLRSYPVTYVPQPLSSQCLFDPPSWRQSSPAQNPTRLSTVTMDELTLSMSRLTLRHRRQSTRPSTHSTCSVDDIPSGSTQTLPATQPSNKSARVRSENGRKVAGCRRAMTSTKPVAPPTSPVPFAPATPAGAGAGVMSTQTLEAPCKARKRSGPPRRKPAAKTLSRQPSDVSLASSSSSSSSTSSRSTSYSSGFSLGSVASDCSFTSVESESSLSGHNLSSSTLDANISLASCVGPPQALQPGQLPVYDLSLPYDLLGPSSAAPDLAALFNDPAVQQLLHGAQVEQQQQNPSLLTQPPLDVPIIDQSLDIGFADVNTYVDFAPASTAFPTLEALLADSTADQPHTAVRSQCDPLLVPPPAQQHDIPWYSLVFGQA